MSDCLVGESFLEGLIVELSLEGRGATCQGHRKSCLGRANSVPAVCGLGLGAAPVTRGCQLLSAAATRASWCDVSGVRSQRPCVLS